MVGVVEGDEALGVARWREQAGRVFNADGVVPWRVKHQQGAAKTGHGLGQLLGANVIQELTLDAKWAAAQIHFRFAPLLDLRHRVRKQVGDVIRVRRRTDGGDGLHFGQPFGHRQHRRAAQAVANQEGHRAVVDAHIRRRRLQVPQVGREVGVGEVPFTGAEAGEVEPQHPDPLGSQAGGDPRRGADVLRAAEAMGEHGPGSRRPVGHFEAGGEGVAQGARKGDFL